jgi:hypothetical protein
MNKRKKGFSKKIEIKKGIGGRQILIYEIYFL